MVDSWLANTIPSSRHCTSISNPVCQESNSAGIILQEDDPAIIRKMIAWMYGISFFSGNPNLYSRCLHLKEDPAVRESAWADMTCISIDIFVAASKYQVPKLESYLHKGLCADIGRFVASGSLIHRGRDDEVPIFTAYPIGFDRVIRHIFVEREEETEKLKEPVMKNLACIIHLLTEYAELDMLLLDIPILSAAVAKTIAISAALDREEAAEDREAADEFKADAIAERNALLRAAASARLGFVQP